MLAHDAVSALVNLSDSLAVARHLMDEKFLIWLVSYTAVSGLILAWPAILTLYRIPHHPSHH